MKTHSEIPLQNTFILSLAEAIEESGSSQVHIAAATGILPSHLSQLKHGKRRLNAKYDLRLARHFGISPGFLLRLQLQDDLDRTTRDSGERIRREVVPRG